MNIESLNKKFSIGSGLNFKQLDSGIIVIEIDTPVATATISLVDGQVLTWQPKSQSEPVLWLSKRAQYISGKAIRGGVPICWPWFGAHPTDSKLPGHGYARITLWNVTMAELLADGRVRVCLFMGENKLSKAHWSHKVDLSVEIEVGNELLVKLMSINQSSQEVKLTEGLHTYFHVGDVTTVRVHGLDGVEYVDLTRNNERNFQKGPISFDAELGRIFLNTHANCVIEDPILKRRITIQKQGSLNTAVWNPWASTAATMVDLGEDGWRNMLCVEGANTFENGITIPSGDMHTHVARYFVKPIIYDSAGKYKSVSLI